MFRATIAVRSVCLISPEMLREMGVRGLLLDIDNTLTTHDNPVPAPGVENWVARMKAAGIALRLVSNNHPPRVEPFARRLGIPCICEGKKPLSSGFRRAMGDQIDTDILGANWSRVKSIYVPPMELEKTAFFRFKRLMEKPFLPKKYDVEESR